MKEDIIDSTISSLNAINGWDLTSVLSKPSDIILGKACMLCGETIPLTKYEKARIDADGSIEPGICDDCRKAWIKIKNQVGK